jgi:hypothetical protein
MRLGRFFLALASVLVLGIASMFALSLQSNRDSDVEAHFHEIKRGMSIDEVLKWFNDCCIFTERHGCLVGQFEHNSDDRLLVRLTFKRDHHSTLRLVEWKEISRDDQKDKANY